MNHKPITGSNSTALPELKREVEIVQRSSGSKTWYLVHDRSNGNHFRINVIEYAALSMCDGSTSLTQVGERLAKLFPKVEAPSSVAAKVTKWAKASRLFHESENKSAGGQQTPASTSKFNPLAFRMTLASPDRLLDKVHLFFGWLFSIPSLILLACFVIYCFVTLAADGRFFAGNHLAAITSGDWIWFLVAWAGLKLLHEFSHAVACRKFGGAVKASGIFFLFGIPMPWVDVSSSLGMDRWQRILICLAGMIAEVSVAAVACLVWMNAEPGPVQFHARNVILVASVYTILFNANPLMRFDGYYVLSDVLSIPNLYTQGRSYVRSMAGLLCFGSGKHPIREAGWRGLFVRFYGVASLIWSVGISIGMVVAAFTCLPMLGLLLGGVGLLYWVLLPLLKLGRHFLFGKTVGWRGRFQFVAVVATVLVGSYALLNTTPGPKTIRIPVVVDYSPVQIARAKAPGFVCKVHVTAGQEVSSGQRLATIENPELTAELRILKLEIRKSKLLLNAMLEAGEIASVRMERSNLDDLLQRCEELEIFMENMEVSAPGDGQILSSDLESLVGTFLRPGDPLLEVGDGEALRAVGMLQQQDLNQVKASDDQKFETFIYGVEAIEEVGSLRVLPRAQTELAHPALAASNGGPIPVVEDPSKSERVGGGWRLPQPRFFVEFAIDQSTTNLRAGQSGVVLVARNEQTMLQYAKNHLGSLLNHIDLGQQGF